MLNERIRSLRVSHNLSQVELAKKLNVSKQSVSNWENDNILPSIEMLVEIAKLFSVSTDYLLGLDDLHTEETLYPLLPFHERLRNLLKSHGISQGKLQRELPLSSSALYGWLSGKRQPALVSLVRLCEYFDCSVDYLIGRIR